MHYYLYEIRNNLNGKIYIGVHRTTNLNDGYMGSGKIIKNAIEKYGVENFSKTILEFFNNEDEMYQREKEVVTDEFLIQDHVYNLRRGGNGGFDYINSSGIKKFHGKKHTEESKKLMGHTISDEEKMKLSARSQGNNFNPKLRLKGSDHPASKAKSEKHKAKISETMKNNKDELYKTLECPHCGKIGGDRALKRWHFDNCKLRGCPPGRGLSLPS